jgi:hypothetical protein
MISAHLVAVYDEILRQKQLNNTIVFTKGNNRVFLFFVYELSWWVIGEVVFVQTFEKCKRKAPPVSVKTFNLTKK